VKSYYVQSQFFKNAVEARKDTSGASDIALVFAFMKVLDPGSVVRETEFATAAGAAGVSSSVVASISYLVGGGKLSDEARGQLFTECWKYYNAAASQYNSVADFYDQRARTELKNYPGYKVYRQPVIDVPEELMTSQIKSYGSSSGTFAPSSSGLGTGSVSFGF
jgi:hypothetical protein